MATNGLINRISIVDNINGLSNVAIISLQGCSFNCLYCGNPETISNCVGCGRCIDSCITGALTIGDDGLEFDDNLCNNCDECLLACNKNSFPKALPMSVEQIINKIMSSKNTIAGIFITGGECSLQIDFVTALFKCAKTQGLKTFVDSNGSKFYGNYPDFLALCDGIFLDVKSFDNKFHYELTGQENSIVLQSLEFLLEQNKLHEVETVIIPTILNNEQTVDEVSKIIANKNKEITYRLIKFNAHGVRQNLLSASPPTDKLMNDLVMIAQRNGLINVVIS